MSRLCAHLHAPTPNTPAIKLRSPSSVRRITVARDGLWKIILNNLAFIAHDWYRYAHVDNGAVAPKATAPVSRLKTRHIKAAASLRPKPSPSAEQKKKTKQHFHFHRCPSLLALYMWWAGKNPPFESLISKRSFIPGSTNPSVRSNQEPCFSLSHTYTYPHTIKRGEGGGAGGVVGVRKRKRVRVFPWPKTTATFCR